MFFNTIEKVFSDHDISDIEYLFVDDGSSDGTLTVLRNLQRHNDTVHYLSFSRNFGKEAAIFAGLQHVHGDYVAIMDADLQDPPEMLPEMIKILNQKKYDCVGAVRTDREGEKKLISFFSNLFYKIVNHWSDVPMVPNVRDFRMMTRQMVDAVLEISERNRFSKGIFSWVGFDTKYLPYRNRERAAGQTSWSFLKLVYYAASGIINFSVKPLAIATWLGATSFILSILGIIFIIIRKIMIPASSIAGWPSLICLILLVGGVQLLCLGILGQYIGKLFTEVKNRPVYIVKETK